MPPAIELPPWTGVLNEVLRKMPALRPVVLEPKLSGIYKFLNQDAPIAFEELLLPFLEVAREKLHAATSGKYHSLAEKARAHLERALLQRLAGISSRVLLVEFRTFVACQQMWGGGNLPSRRGNEAREEYLNFVKDTYGKGWAPLFQEYCVLARLLATALLQWVEATGEFLERLAGDLPEIHTIFLGEKDAGNIAAVQTDLADPHNGGRTVILVEFDSGAKVVYKPKSLDLDIQYFRFIDWLNGLEQTLPLRCLKIINRGSYGWVECVENLACQSEEEARRYYRRSGMFLCLIYALNGMDFHFENLVACGEHPVPVDLETIYHHVAENPAADPELTDAVAQRLGDSVLRTHLLPNPVKLHGRYFDISGLTRSAEEEDDFELLTWKNVNTDAMDYSYQKIKPQFAANLPKLKGKYLSPDNYLDEIVEGFRQMYRLLLDHQEVLLAAGSPLHQVFCQEARFIFRATTIYLSILKNAINPDYLRDGVDFTIQLEALARYFLKAKGKEKPKLWPLMREEIEALWQMDVPRFAAPGDRNSLILKSGEVLSDCFQDSAWNLVQKKIRGFGEEDLKWQVSLIKGSMDGRDAKRLTSHLPAQQQDTDDDSASFLSKKELLANAVAVAREIEKAAIYSEKQEPSWLVLEYLPGADQFALRSVKYDLYNGRCGIALFLAALEKALPGSGYRQMAYATLALVRRWLERAGTKEIESLGLGGLVGIPSVVYSLARIGAFLGDAGLLAEARRAASWITKKQIDSDAALDVIGGSAGTILCLLACHEAAGGEEILDKAVACGRHLLATREADKSGFHTWPTLGKKHLTGFSHGAAGIAYALLKLYQKTGEREFYEAAADGVNFESHEFAPEENNWPDHREFKEKGRGPSGPVFMVAWCHGAPGIGLARLGALNLMDSPNIRKDIQSALITTSRGGVLPRDHICCGNAGLAETLLMAGLKLADPGWTQEALRIMSKLVLRAKRRGSIGVTFRSGFFNPSLFQGAAGVGYQFLRLACPDIIPSVLLLE
ncbi:MAG: type 2 lantipeptide synthetase LanM [Deltaproteobacteria bacterium]|nr:type 2 lantipeptide synthetase LanM [Deltaproteobacteria bacterium]